jgi:general secretion pathway protein G
MRRGNQHGLTLIELIVAVGITSVLATMAVPLARGKVRAMRERDLRIALSEIRTAIDTYKDNADLNYLGPQKQGGNNWPESLDILVEGVKLPGPDGKRMRFLRRIPLDPFTGKKEWGMRSDQDDPKSQSWGGQNLFDVYTKTMEKAPDGTPYSEW